jgi:hypothetical protein
MPIDPIRDDGRYRIHFDRIIIGNVPSFNVKLTRSTHTKIFQNILYWDYEWEKIRKYFIKKQK